MHDASIIGGENAYAQRISLLYEEGNT